MAKNGADREIAIHILPSSSNLLGICFIILSFVKINRIGAETSLDEFLTAPVSCFFLASILSYLSLRSARETRRIEAAADVFFIVGLFSLTVISIVFVLEIMS